MSTIVTRIGKGSPLTWTEMDDNFTNLNTDKIQSGDNVTLGDVTVTSISASSYVNLYADDVIYTPAGTIAATNVQDAIEELDIETQTALSQIINPGGTTGIGTYLVTGASIAWVSGLTYRVGAASYYIDGVAVTSAEQNVTLTSAPPTDDRIDVLALDASGVLSAIAGTPATDPAEPSIDPAVYLRLGIVYVQAASTEPDIVRTDIYLNNAEWTTTASAGTIDVNSTNNPRSGAKDIEGTNVAANTYVSMVKPAAGTVDLATQNSLIFYVRLKAAFPSTKAFRLGWYSGTALRGTQVTVSNGLFGFNSATAGSYQQIVVPISAFNMPTGNLVTTLRVTIIGSGANVGFYLDDIVMDSGATTIPSLTASRALISNVSGNVAASVVTATELGYVSGVTSAIQTQLDGKAPVSVTQNSQSAAYGLILTDANKHIFHPASDNNARTFTIPANASVAYPIGTVITFVNMINTVTIAITSDTMYLAGAGTTGSRTLAANGMATALKISSTEWIINGTGLT